MYSTQIIGCVNGLSPAQYQATIWNNADLLSIGSQGCNYNQIWIKKAKSFFQKIYLKKSRNTFSHFVQVQLRWLSFLGWDFPDSKVHEANMGPTWVLWATDTPHEPCNQVCACSLANQQYKSHPANGINWTMSLHWLAQVVCSVSHHNSQKCGAHASNLKKALPNQYSLNQP